MVSLLGAGGDAVAADVEPAYAVIAENADQAAAFLAHRDGLVIIVGVVGPR